MRNGFPESQDKLELDVEQPALVSPQPRFLNAYSVTLPLLAQLVIGAVWIFHGLYSKVLRGIPRHRAIVARVLGERYADLATTVIGVGEIAVGLWVFTGWQRVPCAALQTAALISMNVLEVALAADLLISAIGMLVLNAGFLTVVWYWATAPRS